MIKTTAYPSSPAFMAHAAHVARDKQDDSCRICADHGTSSPVSWTKFVAAYPEWAQH